MKKLQFRKTDNTSTAHPQYWKVKAAFLQHQQTVAAANASVASSSATLNDTIRAAGLDPDKTYAMNDTDETITLKP